jgi:hypothetical protein
MVALLGVDANWDLFNYHYYNGFSAMTNRLNWDIAPAMRQSYFNPVLDLPTYWLISRFGTGAFTLAAAAVQALLIPVVWLLTYAVCGHLPGKRRQIACGLLTLIAVVSPINLLELGTSYGDNTTALLILLSLLLVIAPQTHGVQPTLGRVFAAGLLCGVAAGLKLTNMPYCLGLAAVALYWVILPPAGCHRQSELRRALVLGAGLGFGIMASYGPWGWYLFSMTGNPFFPQFNHIFQSDWAPAVNFVDASFKADNFTGMLLFPFVKTSVFGNVNYLGLFDLRIAMVLILAITVAFSLAVKKLAGLSASVSRQDRLVFATVILFFLASYAAWLGIFSINRYAVVLEILAPITMVALIAFIWSSPSAVWVALALIITVVPLSMFSAPELFLRPGDRRAWNRDPLTVSPPLNLNLKSAPLIVMLGGDAPTGFVVPGFPPSTRFIRVTGNLYWPHPDYRRMEDGDLSARPAVFDTVLLRRACALVTAHAGPLFALSGDPVWLPPDRVTLDWLGLQATDECQPVAAGVGQVGVRMCRLERTAAAACQQVPLRETGS